MEERLVTLEKEIVFFLKSIIKAFPMHSQGIKWIVNRLARLRVPLSQSDFPD
jgi:hypothetical protein